MTRRELIRFQRACLRDGRTRAVMLADEAQLRLLRRHADLDRLQEKLIDMRHRAEARARRRRARA